MQQKKMSSWRKIEIGVLVAIIGLVIALAQLWQSKVSSDSQDSAQATQVKILQEQNKVLSEIATLQAGTSLGSTATIVSKRIQDLDGTRVALTTTEASVKQYSSREQSITVRANIEWENTGILVNEGETVDVKYVSGKWHGSKDSTYWFDGTDCNGFFGWALVPNSSGNALVARVGSSEPNCVGNKPFVSSKSGALFLSFNDCSGCFADNEGSIVVHVKVYK